MRERILLKIGEFARIGQVSIATLRYYDQCGLLKPNALDPDTAYRYYSLDQLARLNRILALKELDFPLEQIAELLEKDLSLDQLRGMFELKQAQTQQLIETEQARLMRIAARLRQIEQEGKMPAYEVLLKQVAPLLVASIRDRIPNIGERGHLYDTLSAYLEQQGLRSPALSFEHAVSIRRRRVSGCLVEPIQRIQSQRAIGVISIQRVCACGVVARAFFKSAGTLGVNPNIILAKVQ